MQATVTTSGSSDFPSTHWSIIVAAGQRDSPAARLALEDLCRAYWFPLYTFVRRHGYDAHTAQDTTQDFFAQLLEANRVSRADPARGRFRSFLLGSMRNFLSHQRERRAAQKRGGNITLIPLDATKADARFQLEPPSPELTPEEAYDRAWALQVIERALAVLESDYTKAGHGEMFKRLRQVVWGDREGSVESIAAELSMNPGAVKVAIHRLRRRLREQLRSEIGRTVSTDSETEEELHLLLAALRPSRPPAV